MTQTYLQCLLLILALLVTATMTCSVRASYQSRLDEQVERFEVTDTPIDRALDQLSKEYQLVVGVELHRSDSSPGPQNSIVTVNLYHASARDALNAVINSAGGRYRWEEADGVVNVICTDAGGSFLDTAVTNFFIMKQDRVDAINRLLAWPEVAAALQRLELTRRDIIRPTDTSDPRLVGFSLPLQNTTVRKTLNNILLGSRSRYWAVARHGDHSQYFSLSMW